MTLIDRQAIATVFALLFGFIAMCIAARYWGIQPHEGLGNTIWTGIAVTAVFTLLLVPRK